jgi:hypothetical protein
MPRNSAPKQRGSTKAGKKRTQKERKADKKAIRTVIRSSSGGSAVDSVPHARADAPAVADVDRITRELQEALLGIDNLDHDHEMSGPDLGDVPPASPVDDHEMSGPDLGEVPPVSPVDDHEMSGPDLGEVPPVSPVDDHEMSGPDLGEVPPASPVRPLLSGPEDYEAAINLSLFGPASGNQLWGSMALDDDDGFDIPTGPFGLEDTDEDQFIDYSGGFDTPVRLSGPDQSLTRVAAQPVSAFHPENGGGSSATSFDVTAAPIQANSWTPVNGAYFINHGITEGPLELNEFNTAINNHRDVTASASATFSDSHISPASIDMLIAENEIMGSDISMSVHPSHPQSAAYRPIIVTGQISEMQQVDDLHAYVASRTGHTIDPSLLAVDDDAGSSHSQPIDPSLLAVDDDASSSHSQPIDPSLLAVDDDAGSSHSPPIPVSPGPRSTIRQIIAQRTATILATPPKSPQQRAEYTEAVANDTALRFINAPVAKKLRRPRKDDGAAKRVHKQRAQKSEDNVAKVPTVLTVFDKREKRKMIGEKYTPFQKVCQA